MVTVFYCNNLSRVGIIPTRGYFICQKDIVQNTLYYIQQLLYAQSYRYNL